MDPNSRVSDAPENVSDDSETPTTEVDDSTTVSDDGTGDEGKVAYATHKKLMGQHKKTKAQMESLQAKIDQLENSKLEDEGKKDEVIAKLKDKVNELESSNKKIQGSYAFKSIKSQITNEALKMGCVDPDVIIHLADISELDADPDTFEADPEDVKNILDEVKKTRPYLFKKPNPSVTDGPAGGGKPSNEESGYLAELKKCRTQHQFDAVRRKYGKM